MFLQVTSTPIPYVLNYERMRKDANPTLWGIVPFTAPQWQSYKARWRDQEKKYGVAEDIKAQRACELDRETLRGNLKFVRNAYAVGDEVTDEIEVAGVVEKLDDASLQELLIAAGNMSVLEEGRKN